MPANNRASKDQSQRGARLRSLWRGQRKHGHDNNGGHGDAEYAGVRRIRGQRLKLVVAAEAGGGGHCGLECVRVAKDRVRRGEEQQKQAQDGACTLETRRLRPLLQFCHHLFFGLSH